MIVMACQARALVTRLTVTKHHRQLIRPKCTVAVPHTLANTDQTKKSLARDTRRVLRRLPSPVVVVTTKGKDGTLRGITCSSFTSVSLDPPIVSFCITRPSSTAELLSISHTCAVNLLSAKQVNISNHFAKGAPSDKGQLAQFKDISHHVDPETGMPVLHGTLGAIFCTKREALEAGDHLVWFGNVTSVHEGAPGSPLVYYARTYRNVGEEAFMRKFESAELAFDRWTHVAHVRMAWNYIQAYGLADALPHIREGINRYNLANADKVRHGYNESITNFYAYMIAHALESDKLAGIDVEDVTFPDFLHRHGELANKSLIREYYSDRVLHSEAARKEYVQAGESKPTKRGRKQWRISLL